MDTPMSQPGADFSEGPSSGVLGRPLNSPWEPSRSDFLVKNLRKNFSSLYNSGHKMPSVFGHSSTMSGNRAAGKERRSSVRNLLRRASSVFKRTEFVEFRRRASDISNDRPSTSSSFSLGWEKSRNSNTNGKDDVLSTVRKSGGDSQIVGIIDAHVPIPGNGTAPPVIPGGGGDAARATAAAQNQLRARQPVEFLSLENKESAVDLTLSLVDSSRSDKHTQPREDIVIRKDFITDLPCELAMNILSRLDHSSLSQVLQVSSKWYETASADAIWQCAFIREKSSTYAMDKPVAPGSGLGMPAVVPQTSWKDIYRIRQQLEKNWKHGNAENICLRGHFDSVYCLQFDEHKIITGSRDKTLRVWDIHTYECLLVIGPGQVIDTIESLYEQEGSQVSAEITDADPSCNVWSRPQTVSWPMCHNASILCLQYDADILVTGSSDGTAVVYSIKDNYRPIRRLEGHKNSHGVLDLAFDDKHIVTCSKDHNIIVWDRATGQQIKKLKGHTGPVNSVQLRGNIIVSCSGDFSVKLWNIETGQNIRELEGHTKGLACSQFSEDGRFIASAGNDRVIRIWDAHTGACLQTIDAHENLVRCLHIDAVSGRLISGSYDQDIKVFDMKTGETLLDFQKWHSSWVLGAKSDYRRIISSAQDGKILIEDFGGGIKNIDLLNSPPILPKGSVPKLKSIDKGKIVAEKDENERLVWELQNKL